MILCLKKIIETFQILSCCFFFSLLLRYIHSSADERRIFASWMKWNLIKNADWISFDSLSLSPRCLCCCCCSSTWEMSKIEKEKSFHFLLCCCLLLGRLCMREGGGWDEPVSSAKIQVELEFFFCFYGARLLYARVQNGQERDGFTEFFLWFFSSSQRLSGWGPEKIMKWIYFSSSSLARLQAPLQSALLHVVWVKKTTQKKMKKERHCEISVTGLSIFVCSLFYGILCATRSDSDTG